jgi:phosphoribosylamine-glycine ligase
MIHQTTGEYVLVASGLGKTVAQAQKKVYGAIKKIHFPNKMYRTDIGDKVIKSLPELHGFGYALEMEA